MTVSSPVFTLGNLSQGDTFVFNGDVTGTVYLRTDSAALPDVKVVRLADGALGNRDASEGVLKVKYNAVPA